MLERIEQVLKKNGIAFEEDTDIGIDQKERLFLTATKDGVYMFSLAFSCNKNGIDFITVPPSPNINSISDLNSYIDFLQEIKGVISEATAK